MSSYDILLYATAPIICETRYGFSQGSVGLSLMSIGVGTFIGLVPVFDVASFPILTRG